MHRRISRINPCPIFACSFLFSMLMQSSPKIPAHVHCPPTAAKNKNTIFCRRIVTPSFEFLPEKRDELNTTSWHLIRKHAGPLGTRSSTPAPHIWPVYKKIRFDCPFYYFSICHEDVYQVILSDLSSRKHPLVNVTRAKEKPL